MTTYLAQFRVVKLPNPDAEPDRWSSATSTMTTFEISLPFHADDHGTGVDTAGNLAGMLIMANRLSHTAEEYGGG